MTFPQLRGQSSHRATGRLVESPDGAQQRHQSARKRTPGRERSRFRRGRLRERSRKQGGRRNMKMEEKTRRR